VGEVRSRWLLAVLITASALVFVAVLYLTRYRNFFYDEWAWIISRRAWDFNAFILPHGNHWSTIPVLLWKILFVTVGIRSHIPYEAALLVVHIVVVFLLFFLIRGRSGDLPAFAAALTLLVLGSGADEIVWAFQVAWAGSVAFGLLAMLLLEGKPTFPGRVLPVTAALLGSLMCSSVGVAFLVAVGTELLFDRERRRFLLALVIPLAAFFAWLLIFDTGRIPGAGGITGDFLQGPKGLAFVTSVAEFVLTGLRASAAGVVGLVGTGWLALPIIGVLIAWNWYRKRQLAPWQIGLIVGVLFWFLLVSLGRVKVGVSQASQTRYVYVAVVFLLPLLANVVRDLPWKGLWRPALVAAFGLVLIGNATQLLDAAGSLDSFMRYEKADLQTVETFRDAPDIATVRYLDNGLMPQVIIRDYLAATRELGSPASASDLHSLRQLPEDSRSFVDRVMVNLFGDALSAQPMNPGNMQGMSCQRIESTTLSKLDFPVANDQSVVVQSSDTGQALLFLGFANPPTADPLKRIELPASVPLSIHVPNTGKPVVWQLRIQPVNVERLLVCQQIPTATRPNRYSAAAASFTFGPGWSAVTEAAATTGRAARAAAGTIGPGAFGGLFMPAAGPYDIWYRIRVANSSGGTAEMLLAVVDVDANRYAASTTLRPNQVGTAYSWILVASNITPTSGHQMRFQTNISARLSTDWYVDEAVMVSAGTPMPQSA
jgi:hypothetical protein